MKFCDKLASKRKENNLSQEQLADRLGVSRQAVSKWESGSSVPDMAKILELCKILNCSLDELVDDTAGGNKEIVNTKNSINGYLKEVLDFITKTINMFWSMTLGEKVKCILEMLFVILILYAIWGIVGMIISSIFDNILYMLPWYFNGIIKNICLVVYSLFGVIVGIVIVIHIFKIRYLDYFVTIEDNNIIDKSIEVPVENNEKNENIKDNKIKFIEKKKNKIIIRDPKHSTYTFFDFLGKIIIYIIKAILLFVAVPCICSFVVLCLSETFSIWLIHNGIFFLGTSILLVGLILINYLVLRIIYNFVLNQKSKFNLLFIIFIIGLLLTGVGAGVTFCSYLTFDKRVITNSDIEYTTKSEEIEMTDNTILEFINHNDVELIEDNSRNNIKIEFTYNEEGDVNLYNYISIDSYIDYDYEDIEFREYSYNYVDLSSDYDFFDEVNYLIEQVKNKERLDYDYLGVIKIKIYASSDNLEKLKDNYAMLYE